MTKRLEELMELALNKELTKKTRTELVKMLFIDKYGNIDLSELQLQDFEGNLYQNGHKVKWDLCQKGHEVGRFLYQGEQDVKLILYQSGSKVKGNLYQNCHKVKGNFYQHSHKVEGYASIGSNDFAGIIEWDEENWEWNVTKKIIPYEDMSKEDLIAEIKKLKEMNNG